MTAKQFCHKFNAYDDSDVRCMLATRPGVYLIEICSCEGEYIQFYPINKREYSKVKEYLKLIRSVTSRQSVVVNDGSYAGSTTFALLTITNDHKFIINTRL